MEIFNHYEIDSIFAEFLRYISSMTNMKSKLSIFSAYVLATLAMFGAVMFRILLVPVIGVNTAYLTVFPTIAVIAVIAGTGPALFAAVVGTIMSERWAFGPTTDYVSIAQLSRGLIVIFTGGAVGYLASKLKDARQKAEAEAEASRRSEAELRKITMDLQIAKNAAEAANNEKLKFLATMSHELRTPLTSILGFSDLLGGENLTDEERKDLLARVKRNGDLLTRLIDEILDLSKIESGKIELEFMEVNLLDLMKDVTGVLSLQAEKKGIELKTQVDGSVPETVIMDPTRLRQILSNLIGNAIKFTSKGWVKVELKIEPEKNEIQFLIEDTGEGIDAENAEKIFEPFVQADSSYARRFGGTGLGLNLARKIARTLGGDVTLVKSFPQGGSVFLVTIALRKAVADSNAVMNPSKIKASATKEPVFERPPLKGVHVLVTDDSVDNRLLISKLLSMDGAHVEVASSGEAALQKTMTSEFDVILMDIQMPVMDGYEVTRRLRERGYQVPIIALTACAMKSDIEQSIKSGCDDHIAKPLKKADLVAAILRQLPKFVNA